MDVSVIVLNFNGAHMLPDALESLNQQTAPGIEILVADNGSRDQSEEVTREYGAKFVPLGLNYGFAVANNMAQQEARGRFIFFVNNDMKFERECVESLAATLLEHRDAFAVDCVQYQWGTRKIVHGGTTIRRGTRRSQPLPYVEIDPCGIIDRLTAVPWTCAGNMMVRRNRFQALDGFDSTFFMNGEDVDICLRAWMRGWPSLFLPPVHADNGIYHKVGATNRRLRDWRLARSAGNYMRISFKSATRRTMARSALGQAASVTSMAIAGNVRPLSGFGLGLLWNLRLLRSTLTERRRVLSMAKYPFERILDAFFDAEGAVEPDRLLRYLDADGRNLPEDPHLTTEKGVQSFQDR